MFLPCVNCGVPTICIATYPICVAMLLGKCCCQAPDVGLRPTGTLGVKGEMPFLGQSHFWYLSWATRQVGPGVYGAMPTRGQHHFWGLPILVVGVAGVLPVLVFFKRQKKHMNFFSIDFLAPHPETPCWGPEKVYVPHFLRKNAKKGPT